ncbi:hypothetical protein [uncultured Deinococcus sp.]|uniref:hypothetical protein n=1 Tax=uncultured Deinococcus sp. TaxID=158789 RepID=UPI0033903E17
MIGAHSPALIAEVLRGVLDRAGVDTTDLPPGLRLSRRAGRTLLQNWTAGPLTWNGIQVPPVSFQVRPD